MHIPLPFLLLASTLLPGITAHKTKKSQLDPILAVPLTHQEQLPLHSGKKDELLRELEDEFSTHMTTHKTTMKSHLASLAEILGMELNSLMKEDLETLLSTIGLVLGEDDTTPASPSELSENYNDLKRGGKGKVRGGSASKKSDRKKERVKGGQADVEEKMETFVKAMGIVEEMKELHLALNLWLVGIREKIRALKGKSP
ncbi:hypothetical protein HYALB_00011272 [Hymenoscyphus albidus]|uniref:Uncharacterized protein n=1 Tax=Hymenoscyphus albidus TaxID=595503 RepID=A0A9N9LU38_9HELO|nr:hypothetical protein HYALB_00011272 [Hymenoscyphus albidus]